MVAELIVATTEPGSLCECFGTLLESGMEELAKILQQLETQVGQQRAVIKHQQMRQQSTIDADRTA